MTAVTTDTGIALSFSGRFKFGIDQWAYVPFDVPAGIQRIDVSTSHDQFSLLGIGRNVLDLGIFGPAGHELGNAAGFRGWSGGARAGFMLSAINATPGYLAGPIDPGQWALALGPVVLNPLGMDWQAQIALVRGVQPSLRRSADCRSRPCTTVVKPGWYRGDLHTHTVHSDGRRRIEEMAEAATSAGLDFIVSTDHNTNSANRAWAAISGGRLEVIAGEEVTTRHGHWLAVGLPPGWLGRLAIRTTRRRLRRLRRPGPRGRRRGGGRASFGAAAGLCVGVRLPRRRRHGGLERSVECR